MIVKANSGFQKFKAVTRENIRKLPIWERLSPELQEAAEVVSAVLPFRTNSYVVEELIIGSSGIRFQSMSSATL